MRWTITGKVAPGMRTSDTGSEIRTRSFPLDGCENPRLRQREDGIALPLVLAVIALLALATAAGVSAFLVLRERAEPSEQTARFLPADTQLYFSFNLRPPNDQLRKLRDILERFREHPNFQRRIDDWLDDAEEETGIDLKEAVFPWLGPEVAVAVLDVVDSAEAQAVGGTPLVIGFFGTRDPESSQDFLEDWLDYQHGQGAPGFEEDEYRGFPTFTQRDGLQRYAVTEDYLLFATDSDLLEETIDRIEDGDPTGSLYESGRFQEARDAAPEPRFSMLYVDSESIWRDIRRLAGGQLSQDLSDRIDDFVPEWATLTGSLVNKGIKLAASTPRSGEDKARELSLIDAQNVPADTLVLVAFAVDPDLGRLREELRKQRVDDLQPGLYETLSFNLGLAIEPDATLSDLLDAALDNFRETVGIDLERDLLDWMTGEFSLSLLPTDFEALGSGPDDEAIRAAALIQFDPAKRDTVTNALNNILRMLEEKVGLVGRSVSYAGAPGASFDLTDFIGGSPYAPGYLILEDHLLVATTLDTLELVASLQDRQADSLAQESGYVRLLEEFSGTSNPLVYVNIGAIREAIVATLDPADRREYREEGEPFVEPLRALLLAGESQKGINRFSFVIIIE